MSLLTRARLLTTLLPEAVACRQTAAHVWGLATLPWSKPETDIPVDLITPTPLDIPGCRTHQDPLPQADVTTHTGIRVTTQERTALDCARHLPRHTAVAALDQFLRLGLDLDTLARQVSGFWRLRDTLAMADAGAASPRESWLRVTLMEACLPRPTTQIHVPLSADRRAYLDLGWPDFKVAVEYDGNEHHSTPGARARDQRRRDALRALGWRVITVDRTILPARTADLLEVVTDALMERGWQPGPARMTAILSRIRAARRPTTHRRRTWRTFR
ncbi:hypothetical protein [Nonomuraea sp. NPDC050310]|uniref:hypothetical protein n=1 Tax=Nonomuraea sp. NPDC050310 TaxID=3154935 RepID=UPI0034066AC2